MDATITTCAVEGCGRPAQKGAWGWCQRHYSRWKKRGGDLSEVPNKEIRQKIVYVVPLKKKARRPKSPKQGSPCSVKECSRGVVGRGLCMMHYARWRRHGDTTDNLKRRSPTSSMAKCLVDGCSERAKARGLCSKHYQNWRNHGTPVRIYHRASKPKPICSIEGCSENVRARGWCEKHYRNWRRNGNPVSLHPKKPKHAA